MDTAKAIQSIFDAQFIRDSIIPLCMQNRYWNLAISEANQSIELLLKGMLRFLSEDPRRYDHDLSRMLKAITDRYSDIESLFPFVVGLYASSNSGVGLFVEEGRVHTVVNVHGVLTMIGSVRFDADLSVGAEWDVDVDGSTLTVLLNEKEILTGVIRGAADLGFKATRHYSSPPSIERLRHIRRASKRLGKIRNPSRYGEHEYDEAHARSAIEEMNLVWDYVATIVDVAPVGINK